MLQQLEIDGHMKAEEIVRRDRWNTKRREKFANQVVDEMEQSGTMRELYGQFKQTLDAARNANVSEMPRLCEYADVGQQTERLPIGMK